MSHLDDHPRFARITHLLNLILFALFIVTGFIIHYPYSGMNMDLIRDLHFIFVWLFLINGVVRIYWAIFSKHKDWREFIPTKRDIKSTIPQLKYYLFMGKHPVTGKYNIMQKLAYLVLFLMGAIQFCSGALLLWSDALRHWVDFFGGLAQIRSFHFLFTWLFVVIIAIHLYLVFRETPHLFKVMIFGIDDEKKKPADKKAKMHA